MSDKANLPATYYQAPDGRKIDSELVDIDIDDVRFFVDGGYHVSMECLNDRDIILYSTTGIEDEDGEEMESIYVVPEGQDLFQAVKELRKLVESVANIA